MRLESWVNVSNAALMLLIAGCCGRCCEDLVDTSLETGGVEVDTDTDVDADTDTDTEVHGVHGIINGTVTVTLFQYDEDGNIEYLAWEDTCFGDVFPYGDIFVAAYTSDEETGAETYYDEDTVLDPSVDGSLNEYTLEVDTDDVDAVYAYAVLDKWFDRIIEPSDPVGIVAQPIVLQGGETVNDVNIDIITEYWCGGGDCPDCPPGWGSGSCYSWDGTGWVVDSDCGSGCPGDTVTVGGDLEINVPYNGTGSDVATLLLYPGTDEVWWAKPDLAVTGDEEGALGAWGYTYCANYGSYVARGVWDDNNNTLYDPSDTWGQPVDGDGEPLNSITFGEEDEEVTMLIPVGDSGFDIVPFVRVSGVLSRSDGTWDELLAENPNAHVYVIGAKYQLDSTIGQSELENTWDYDVFDPEDLAGAGNLSYTLLAPRNVSIYLFAVGDLDGDGTLDPASEGFACGGDDETCWMRTGDQDVSERNMGMIFEAPE